MDFVHGWGGQNWNKNGLQNKGEKKREDMALFLFHMREQIGPVTQRHLFSDGMKGEKKCTVPSQMAKPSKKGPYETLAFNTGALPSNQTAIHVALGRKV